MIRRISITGPESTGKTWLSKKLADYFNGQYVEEYSRTFFANRPYEYNMGDLDQISDGQILNESKAEEQGKWIFCDTDILSIKVWSEVVFNRSSDHINYLVNENRYDLYLLCNLDIKWEPDPLRRNKHNRQYIFDLFVKELKERKFNFAIVEDTGDQRLQNAVSLIKRNFQIEY